MKTIALASGERAALDRAPGIWRKASPSEAEVVALRLGLELGMTLIATAEMSANGGAEEIVGAAIAGRRNDVFLVSKVLPHNATRRGTIAACERSLRRLQTDRLDLYLLHWRGDVPLEETLAGFESLIQDGKIRYWGVSNFDVADMEELVQLPGGGDVAANQVLYNLSRRGIEFDLLPLCRERHIPIMAYSPIEQGRILGQPALQSVAARHSATPAQVALAWLLRQDGLMVIPKASTMEHVRENRGALDVRLTKKDLADLDHAFLSPTVKKPLEML